MKSCYHCGEACKSDALVFDNKDFCCNGCKTVYEILSSNDLDYYYQLDDRPGISPKTQSGKFDFLKNEEITEKLLEFKSEQVCIINLLIPEIHCSSCIWVLENLSKLHSGVKNAQVNFPEKTVRIHFSSETINLYQLVELLCKLGYEPYISLSDGDKSERKIDRSLIYKLGIAGFAFGNVMFLSFPEYFEVKEFWLDQFKYVFRWLMFGFSLPVVFYSASGYFVTAFKGLKSGILNIDVPIALGITVLFIRSAFEVFFDLGTGFFDSLTGLVFFLLLGRFFQQKTYSYLSFERDYKSYFPIGVTRINHPNTENQNEEQVEVYKLRKGDEILIRNNELIPVDARLVEGEALIDYSFVTGEAIPVTIKKGEKIYAGGKQTAGLVQVEVIKAVEQSYLTQLWNNEVFDKDFKSTFQDLTNRISGYFTKAILSISIIAALVWYFINPSMVAQVFTAVLIIACPCALALAAPFTLGNLLRIFGQHKFYLKEANIIEKMAHIDAVVFDKTGTLTSTKKNLVTYEGISLSEEEKSLLNSTLRASNHPLSRSLYDILEQHDIKTLDHFTEEVGKGMEATSNQNSIKVGAFKYVAENTEASSEQLNQTTVHISANNLYKGRYILKNEYRKEIKELFLELGKDKDLFVLSGDNDGERKTLEKLLPLSTKMSFNQKPQDKLQFIKKLQQEGKSVMMIGDGLNDAGALKQSDVGIVISENINVFSPACDAILDASVFGKISQFFSLSKSGHRIIKMSFLFSLFYNLIGLGFAITGHLSPIVAAILMPLSSISIVAFTTIATQISAKNILKKQE
ncbi:heavy metal translocating P-type ATPase [Zunongwangia sp. HRR-M8]|uniref:heavy metal translocating P-type ATPase n=1 Tax=Zunongwangia sp. HRR-M8 TaxID=3015170 RepID=UPI0022DE8427|nr:heavy metal translocating P-type ATPase metal-binding domain-containing protein [Zunongwangia sp. HRR-M8]WBL21151.1 heavy metal translocating P-type ATPase metal-binding domain-containing protein [Zunongwangia sp. HRR-M8]